MSRPRRRLLASLWRPLVDGVRRLLSRETAEREVADEVAHFMEEAERDRMARGATPEEARRAVRLRYGDELPAREDVRSWGWEAGVMALYDDVRLALRRLRRSPGSTTAAVVTAALGVGAATAMAGLAYPALTGALDLPDGERIVVVTEPGDGGSPIPMAFGTFREVAERSEVFAELSVGARWEPTLTGLAEPERLAGRRVSAGHFRVLGVAPALGPGFDPASDRPGGPREVVLSHGLWQARLGGDPAVVGRTVRLDGDPYTVVGVMPASFGDGPGKAQLWSLLRYDPLETSHDSREWGRHLTMIGRLAPGVGPEDAGRALRRIAAEPVPSFPRPAWASLERGLVVHRLGDEVHREARPVVAVLLGAAGLLFLVAVVNVTMLVAGRVARRRGELAVRRALGARGSRLARHLLAESALVALLGGVAGLVLADVVLGVLASAGPPATLRALPAGVDAVALVFAVVVTALLAVVLGLVPAGAMLGGGRAAIPAASARETPSSRSLRRGLVVGEVAMAMILLVGAGLLTRSTRALLSVPPGFEADGVVVLQVHGASLGPDDAATHRVFDEALEAVQDLPGVRSAAQTSQLPLSGDRDEYGVTRVGGEASAPSSSTVATAYRYAVSPGYFRTLGIPPVRGRGLEAGDGSRPRTVVVSRSLADVLDPTGDAIGERLHIGPVTDEPFTVVGVVPDVKQATLGPDRAEAVYVDTRRWHGADPVRWLVLRTTGDVSNVLPAVRRAVWSVDPDLPVTRAGSLSDLVLRSEAERRFAMKLVLVFAGVALALAGIGIYGVVAAGVTDRSRELGVRAALGASPADIVGGVVREGMTLAAFGAVAGFVGALLAGELLSTLLFGVTHLDPVTHVSVALVLAAVAVLACCLPAARATRVDPASTLRTQ